MAFAWGVSPSAVDSLCPSFTFSQYELKVNRMGIVNAVVDRATVGSLIDLFYSLRPSSLLALQIGASRIRSVLYGWAIATDCS